MSSKLRRRGRYHLRGDRLKDAALHELAKLDSWREGPPLTWAALSGRLGVSRQAVEAKPEVVAAFKAARTELQKARQSTPEALVRRSLEDRLTAMQAELASMQRTLDRWVEKWVSVEVQCRAAGIKPDKVLEPVRGRSEGRS